MCKIPDDGLLLLLKSEEQAALTRAINCLHQNLFSKIINMLKGKGMKPEEAEEFFWNGILILEQNAKKDMLRENTIIEGYLKTVCQRMLARKLERDRTIDTISFPVDIKAFKTDELIIKSILPRDARIVLNKLLLQVGGKCQQIIGLFYFQKLTSQEISEELGYASAASVRTTKKKCMKKLRELVNALGGKGLFFSKDKIQA